MDEDRCKEVHEVYDKLVHMHREPWTHRGTSTADPLPLSTWSEFRDKRYDFITEGIVFGLDVPGTMHELIQYTRGELRGAALDQQRVVIPQLVFVKHLLDALGERSQRDVSAHKVVAYASDSGFCPENIEMLKYFGINAVPAVRLPNSAYSLVVDLRTKHWKFFDEKDLGSLFNSQWHLPPSSSWVIPPGAILKRFSTLQLPFPGLVPAASYVLVTYFELPSHVARMLEPEQILFHNLRARFRRDIENELRYSKADADQNGGHSEAAKSFSLSDEDEQRLTQLARNIMVLVVRKDR